MKSVWLTIKALVTKCICNFDHIEDITINMKLRHTWTIASGYHSFFSETGLHQFREQHGQRSCWAACLRDPSWGELRLFWWGGRLFPLPPAQCGAPEHSGGERSLGETKYIIGDSFTVGKVWASTFGINWPTNWALGAFWENAKIDFFKPKNYFWCKNKARVWL